MSSTYRPCTVRSSDRVLLIAGKKAFVCAGDLLTKKLGLTNTREEDVRLESIAWIEQPLQTLGRFSLTRYLSNMHYLTIPARLVAASLSVFLVATATTRKPIGPPAPAIVFTTHQNVAQAMQTLSRVLADSGYATALSSSDFVTTVPRALQEAEGSLATVTLSASVMPATSNVSVIMIWGKQVNNSTGENGYIINDDSRAPTGGAPWDAMEGIQAAVLRGSSHLLTGKTGATAAITSEVSVDY